MAKLQYWLTEIWWSALLICLLTLRLYTLTESIESYMWLTCSVGYGIVCLLGLIVKYGLKHLPEVKDAS